MNNESIKVTYTVKVKVRRKKNHRITGRIRLLGPAGEVIDSHDIDVAGLRPYVDILLAQAVAVLDFIIMSPDSNATHGVLRWDIEAPDGDIWSITKGLIARPDLLMRLRQEMDAGSTWH